MKVGVLYPRSNAYPEMMPDFIGGIRGAITSKGLSDKIIIISESIGFGGSEKEAYEKTEKLIALEKVDFIIAYLDLKVLPLLQPLLYSKDKIMLVVNPGANYPDNWIPHPNIFFLTLQHSFLCWLTGLTASLRDNKEAIVATNFYDAGYLHIAAMTERFTIGGGKIVFNYVNKDIYNKIDITALQTFLSGQEVKNILAVFDKGFGQEFLEIFNGLPASKGKNLFVSPMMLHNSVMKGPSYQFSMQGHVSWIGAQQNESARHFNKHFTETEKTKISMFGLQGWEAGLVISELYRLGKYNALSANEHLSGLSLETPRGLVQFDRLTNYFMGPVYFIEKEAGQEDFNIKEPGYVEKEWKNFTAHPVQGLSSGWTNTYLCY